jgi:hypothetical protein
MSNVVKTLWLPCVLSFLESATMKRNYVLGLQVNLMTEVSSSCKMKLTIHAYSL